MQEEVKSWVESLVAWEKDLFLALNGSESGYLDSVMYFISDKWPWFFFLTFFFFLVGYRQKWKEWLLFFLFSLFLVVVADGLSSGIIKPIFQRLRPTHHPMTGDFVDTVLGYHGGLYGFISGHSTNFFAFAVFTALVLKNRWYTFISLIAALTVAFSRIYLGVHFITDVIPGIIIGVLIGFFIYYLYRWGRVHFLGLSQNEATKSYLRPKQWSNYPALLMTVFYVGIWLFAPLFMRFY